MLRPSTHLYNHFIGSWALSPVHSSFRSCLYSRSGSRLHSRPRARSCPRSCSRPRSHPCSCDHVLLFIPVARFIPRYQIVGQAPSLAPEAADYMQTLPSVYRAYIAYGVIVPDLLLSFFSSAADNRALFLPPFPLHSHPRSRLRSSFCSRSRLLFYLALIILSLPPFLPLSPFPSPVPLPTSIPSLSPPPPPPPSLIPVSVQSFPFLGPDYPLGAMRMNRNQVLRMELLGAHKRHSLSAEMMSRAK